MEIEVHSALIEGIADEQTAPLLWEQLVPTQASSRGLIVLLGDEKQPLSSIASQLKHQSADRIRVLYGTSSQGVMTDHGITKEGIGALCFLHDDKGIGVAIQPKGADSQAAALEALRLALVDAGRPGEQPSALWVLVTSGQEESIVSALSEKLGGGVPITGGTVSTDIRSAKELIGVNENSVHDGIAVVAFFYHQQVFSSFHNGYSATELTGTVTNARGRIILAVNDQPAAAWYRATYQTIVKREIDSSLSLRELASVFPLGHVVDSIAGVPLYRISQLSHFGEDGSIHTHAEIPVGTTLSVMQGSVTSMTTRLSRVVAALKEGHHITNDTIYGALMVLSADCVGLVNDHLQMVYRSTKTQLKQTPFLTLFSSGEQGSFLTGQNCHGNLMMSATIITKVPYEW